MFRSLLAVLLAVPFLMACEEEEGFNFSRVAGEQNTSVIQPNSATDSPIDIAYPNRGQFHRLVAGEGRTCFNRSDKFLAGETSPELDCWGKRLLGDYVNNINKGENNVLAIGRGHVCTIRQDFGGRGVGCVGDNDHGQSLSPDTKTTQYQDDAEPENWKGLWAFNANIVAAGLDHTCVLDQYGVYCWGKGSEGQLDVPVMDNPIWLAAGGNTSCAIDEYGAMHCWGALADQVPQDLVGVTKVDVGDDFVCAVISGDVSCWGNIQDWTVQPADYVNVQHISAGSYHGCVIDDTGAGNLVSHCFGKENATSPFLTMPQSVQDSMAMFSGQLKTIAAGKGYTCASFKYDGYSYRNGTEHAAVECWGNNEFGEADVPRFLCLGFHATARTDEMDTDTGSYMSDTDQAVCQ
jgi:hypothetical protein